ncbi:hypothetical protein KSP40_PGU002479 [Platanthera guangdongensis]|uniref:Uncharacterized protein n=1 Tax=Platanthera guangdongensis TaxID=2320717 RepID=A0ABR2M0H7_9ASPA
MNFFLIPIVQASSSTERGFSSPFLRTVGLLQPLARFASSPCSFFPPVSSASFGSDVMCFSHGGSLYGSSVPGFLHASTTRGLHQLRQWVFDACNGHHSTQLEGGVSVSHDLVAGLGRWWLKSLESMFGHRIMDPLTEIVNPVIAEGVKDEVLIQSSLQMG